MRRAATTPDGAATAVEQQQLDAVLATDVHQLLLSAVLSPGRRRGAGILSRIGVADHHFLGAMQALTVAGQ